MFIDSLRTNGNLRTRNGASARRCFLDYRELVIQNHMSPRLKGKLTGSNLL